MSWLTAAHIDTRMLEVCQCVCVWWAQERVANLFLHLHILRSSLRNIFFRRHPPTWSWSLSNIHVRLLSIRPKRFSSPLLIFFFLALLPPSPDETLWTLALPPRVNYKFASSADCHCCVFPFQRLHVNRTRVSVSLQLCAISEIVTQLVFQAGPMPRQIRAWSSEAS